MPDLYTRGTIRDTRPVAISHGLWDGVPDDYATDQDARGWEMPRRVTPIHPPFAQSSMNLGFRLAVTPAMYQPAQGPDFGMDRFADIWGGLFAQRILMETDGFVNGAAVVYHTRASNREANRLKEAPGREIHEDLWRHVWKWKADPDGAVFVNTWTFSGHLRRFHHPYIQDTAMRLRRWLALISQRERP